MKSLRRRLARQASLSGHDPLMSPSPVPAATPQVSIPVELPTTAALSWGGQLDVCVPLTSVFSTDEEEDALDFEEEGQSDFLLSEEEEDFEDSPFLPPAHMAQPLAAAGTTEDVPAAQCGSARCVQTRCRETKHSVADRGSRGCKVSLRG